MRLLVEILAGALLLVAGLFVGVEIGRAGQPQPASPAAVAPSAIADAECAAVTTMIGKANDAYDQSKARQLAIAGGSVTPTIEKYAGEKARDVYLQESAKLWPVVADEDLRIVLKQIFDEGITRDLLLSLQAMCPAKG